MLQNMWKLIIHSSVRRLLYSINNVMVSTNNIIALIKHGPCTTLYSNINWVVFDFIIIPRDTTIILVLTLTQSRHRQVTSLPKTAFKQVKSARLKPHLLHAIADTFTHRVILLMESGGLHLHSVFAILGLN